MTAPSKDFAGSSSSWLAIQALRVVLSHLIHGNEDHHREHLLIQLMESSRVLLMRRIEQTSESETLSTRSLRQLLTPNSVDMATTMYQSEGDVFWWHQRCQKEILTAMRLEARATLENFAAEREDGFRSIGAARSCQQSLTVAKGQWYPASHVLQLSAASQSLLLLEKLDELRSYLSESIHQQLTAIDRSSGVIYLLTSFLAIDRNLRRWERAWFLVSLFPQLLETEREDFADHMAATLKERIGSDPQFFADEALAVLSEELDLRLEDKSIDSTTQFHLLSMALANLDHAVRLSMSAPFQLAYSGRKRPTKRHCSAGIVNRSVLMGSYLQLAHRCATGAMEASCKVHSALHSWFDDCSGANRRHHRYCVSTVEDKLDLMIFRDMAFAISRRTTDPQLQLLRKCYKLIADIKSQVANMPSGSDPAIGRSMSMKLRVLFRCATLAHRKDCDVRSSLFESAFSFVHRLSSFKDDSELSLALEALLLV